MLPFTKRPGRGDESGESEVVTKDDLPTSEVVAPSKRNVSAASSPGGGNAATGARPKFQSLSDDEMTNVMPSKSIGDALESARAASPRPAAGAPPPSKRDVGSKAAPSSRGGASRSGKFAAMDDEEEEGRTVVRGAPKIVKRSNASGPKMGMPTSPTTISPAAVIKATLESARAGASPKKTGEHLMAGPPIDLLEDLADRMPHPADGPGAEHTAILPSTSTGSMPPPGMVQGVKALSTQILGPQQVSHGTIPPGSARPMSQPPPPNFAPDQSGGYGVSQSGAYNAQQSGGYPAQQSGGYPVGPQSNPHGHYNGPVPSGSVSVPGVVMAAQSMPAHFMVAQAPYSDARIDPPGTALSSRPKGSGRSATSWAVALMAFGVFVGLGAFGVMRGNADGVMETGASFVDPSRANTKAAAATPPAAAQPTPVPVTTTNENPPAASPVAPAPTAPAVDTAAAVAAAPPAVAPPAAAPPTTAAPPAVAPPAATVAAADPPVKKPAIRTFTQPAPQTRPVVAIKDPEPPTPKPAPTTKVKGKPGGDSTAVDEEQKKALKALQESQLESTF